MTDKPIRVGFIGLNPGIHWAATAHIPALKALPNEFVVAGVANTTQGDLQLTGANGHGQMVQLSIHGANGDMSELAPLTPPASAYDGWPDSAVPRNVARVYALVAQDIRSGTRLAPSFRDAVALHETVDAIERSAAGSESL